MDQSLFHIYTIGRAAANRKLSSPILEVYPIEHFGYLDGEVNSDPTTTKASGVDANGKAYTTSVTTTNSIAATWIQWGSNRATPPDIRRGERVLLWRYADTDQYYWTALGMDDYLRKLETVVYAFSDTKDESVKVLTPENSYYLEVSTHKKLVTFSTAKSDGEPYAYTFQFDTANGRVTLADDVGNYVELDTKNTSITLENADDSKVVLDRKVINISSVDAINLNTKAYTLTCDTADYKVAKSNTLTCDTHATSAKTEASYAVAGSTLTIVSAKIAIVTPLYSVT